MIHYFYIQEEVNNICPNNICGGHPFRIQSTTGTSGTPYNTGVTNNGGTGQVIFKVPMSAPATLYYPRTSPQYERHNKHCIGKIMSSCCTRKRTWKDVLYLPMGIAFTLIGFALLLSLKWA